MVTNSLNDIWTPITVGYRAESKVSNDGKSSLPAPLPWLSHPKLRLSPQQWVRPRAIAPSPPKPDLHVPNTRLAFMGMRPALMGPLNCQASFRTQKETGPFFRASITVVCGLCQSFLSPNLLRERGSLAFMCFLLWKVSCHARALSAS